MTQIDYSPRGGDFIRQWRCWFSGRGDVGKWLIFCFLVYFSKKLPFRPHKASINCCPRVSVMLCCLLIRPSYVMASCFFLFFFYICLKQLQLNDSKHFWIDFVFHETAVWNRTHSFCRPKKTVLRCFIMFQLKNSILCNLGLIFDAHICKWPVLITNEYKLIWCC